MATDHRAALREIKTFPQLVAYLRDAMNWPIDRDSFEDVDDLFYDYTAEELGIDAKNSAKIRKIKRLRPLTANQPWGIFFVEFEPKKLPVVALRRILGQVVLKTRTSANAADRSAWNADDLLFISNYGEGDQRQITFAHFSQPQGKSDLPALKVLGWDNLDTAGHLDLVARELTEHLSWPDDDSNPTAWRDQWRSAFTLGHREVITTSKQLSIALAKLAKNIRDRINAALKVETERGPLTKLMNAFRESLLHDLKPDDFADMYAQTIAYGLLSARIADPESKTADDFARHMRTNPFLRELMESFLHVGGRRGKRGDSAIDFDELGVNDVVELLDRANMAAVVADFDDKNPLEDPVIHFYELFLKEYDAKKRMQRGVFYTARPVVSFIVRSVDDLLRTEFGLEYGLADTATWGEMAKRIKGLRVPEGARLDEPFVQILDPACGTGTFLVEVIDIIHKTLTATWEKAGLRAVKHAELWNDYVADFLLPRLHGYELLMAPYAIAHLKIGRKLHDTGYRFGSTERAHVFLTNALEPASDENFRLTAMPALAHEAQAVNETKRKQRFTVVIGNPPYSISSQNNGPWINQLTAPVKEGVRAERNIQPLNDDYVKFLIFAQHLISMTESGIVGMITNRSFTNGKIHKGLRELLQSRFPALSVLDLGGDTRSGDTHLDANVFDITQGVAVSIWSTQGSQRRYARLAGSRLSKYENLLGKLEGWSEIQPHAPAFLLTSDSSEDATEYRKFPSLHELMPFASPGVKTSNDAVFYAFTLDELRKQISQAGIRFNPSCTVRSLYRPLDWRHLYYDPSRLGRSRQSLAHHVIETETISLISMRQVVNAEVTHFGVCRGICCHGTFYLGNKGQDYQYPTAVRRDELFDGYGDASSKLNLSPLAMEWIRGTSRGRIASDSLLWLHYVYAIFHSPAYRTRYAAMLKDDFPRLPLTDDTAMFDDLVRTGAELVSLHLFEAPKLDRLITSYSGPKDQVIVRVAWTDNFVSLDAQASKKGEPPGVGTFGFLGVTEEVWNFHIGGYQVCEKWLKDRKGRTLSDDDIAHYQKIVVAISETIRLMKEIDEVIEQHGGWPGAFVTTSAPLTVAETPARQLRIVEDPSEEERYRTCVPLVPLKAAATNLDQEPHYIVDNEWKWIEVDTKRRLRPGMFVAEVAGRSMEPAIPDGSFCLFDSPVEGSRQGKTVLVKLHRDLDPESGANYTIKRYESEKAADGDSWRHERITLKPNNPDFAPLVFTEAPEEEFAVIAEFLEVIAAPEAEPKMPERTPLQTSERRSDSLVRQDEQSDWRVRPTSDLPAASTDAPAEATPSKSGAQAQLPMQAPTVRRNVDLSAHGLFRKQESAKPAAASASVAAETDDDTDDASPRHSIIDAYETEEVLAIIRDVITTADPMPREDAIKAIATQLGAERVGARIRDFIDTMLNTASRRLIIATVSGGLIARNRHIEDYDRDFLKTALRNVVGRTWTEREQGVRAATRWLGFRRTGATIQKEFKSAINSAIRRGLLERDGNRIRFVG